MRPTSKETPSMGRTEGGFALVAVLLVLLGLSGLAAAGYLVSGTDYRINQNHRASVKAFYVADAGLDHFLGRGRLPIDTVTYNHADGIAKVWVTPLVEVDDSASLFLVSSRGEHRAPEGGLARRQVATVAMRKAVGFGVNAAITAAAGLQKNGMAGTVSGFDAASAGDCPVGGTGNVAGLAVREDGFSMSGGGAKKQEDDYVPPGFFGDPPIYDDLEALALLYTTGVPWQQVLDGSFVEADYVISVDGYPDFTGEIDPDQWPVIYADVAAFQVNPTMSGRGALIVRGDLKIDGIFTWKGVVLVGGALTSNGVERIDGAVIAGLNLLLGEAAGQVDLGNGNWVYQYDACNVMNALKGLGWPVEEPGAWFEVL